MPMVPWCRYAVPHRMVCSFGCLRVRMEASPSPVYGAALLMRFGFTPIRGSNPRASATEQALCRTGKVPAAVSLIISAPVGTVLAHSAA